MTEADFAEIETALGLSLPGEYRAAMLAYPFDSADANMSSLLPDDAPAVITFNRFLRNEFPDDWRESYFALGNSPCGDPYFVDLGSGAAGVYSWDHETHGVVPVARDFAEWLGRLRADRWA